MFFDMSHTTSPRTNPFIHRATVSHRFRNFQLLYVGQILIALAFPFLLNLPVKLSAVWFKKNNRSLPSTIGYLSGLVGILLAARLAATLFSRNATINKMPHGVDLDSPCQSDNPKQLGYKKNEI